MPVIPSRVPCSLVPVEHTLHLFGRREWGWWHHVPALWCDSKVHQSAFLTRSESQRLFDKDATEDYAKSEKSSKKLLGPTVRLAACMRCFPIAHVVLLGRVQYGHGVSSAEAALADARRRHEGVVSGVSMAAIGAASGHGGGCCARCQLVITCRCSLNDDSLRVAVV